MLRKEHGEKRKASEGSSHMVDDISRLHYFLKRPHAGADFFRSLQIRSLNSGKELEDYKQHGMNCAQEA